MIGSDVRQVMRHVASTVTIITTEEQHPFGMVATALMSLSLDPPALVIGINRSASICEPLLKRKAFCVNILSRHDADISKRFAKLKGTDRFRAGSWFTLDHGPFRDIPALATAQANLFCTVQQSIESGTHQLVIGSIKHVDDSSTKHPLVYCDGNYGVFNETSYGRPEALDDRLALLES